MRSKLRNAGVRRSVADEGFFLTKDGADPNWVFDSRMDLEVARKSAHRDLRQAEAELAAAEATLQASKVDFQRLASGVVAAPPGSIVWARRSASGSTVRAGDPVAEWIDCSILLVVVPVLDLQVSLVAEGAAARLLLDGETEWREGTVVLTRGSSSPFNRSDLAAIQVKEHKHAAMVVIDISAQHGDFPKCPVGRSAFVDFPEIGVLDIVAAWLRL